MKHFKHRASGPGKRRIHQTPTRVEVQACRPWLVAEFARLRPAAVVALGATAAQALLGPDFRITRSRGKVFDWPASAEAPAEFPAHDHAFVVATAHPSAVLRADNREIAYAALVDDLRVVKRELDSQWSTAGAYGEVAPSPPPRAGARRLTSTQVEVRGFRGDRYPSAHH